MSKFVSVAKISMLCSVKKLLLFIFFSGLLIRKHMYFRMTNSDERRNSTEKQYTENCVMFSSSKSMYLLTCVVLRICWTTCSSLCIKCVVVCCRSLSILKRWKITWVRTQKRVIILCAILLSKIKRNIFRYSNND